MEKLLNFIKNLFSEEPEMFTGVPYGEQKRTDEINFNETVSPPNVAVVNWKNKKKEEFRTFPKLNQYYSGMCGAFSGRKILGIYFYLIYKIWIDFEESDIYQSRTNKPNAGMWEYDIYRVLAKGVTLKQLAGNKVIKTDADADNLKIDKMMRDVGAVFALGNGELIRVESDQEMIASIIQVTGKPILLTTFFTSSEWSREIPVIEDYSLRYEDKRAMRHYVAAVDYGILNGVRVIKIEDSAWFGGFWERWLTSDWIKHRVYLASYPRNFKFAEGGDKPIYDGTIISLQKCLRFLGYFPIDVDYIENLGPLTKASLKKLQKANGIIESGLLDNHTKLLLISKFN